MDADSPPENADVVVVGGGVIGCAAARLLASDYDVVVVERGKLASEATALAAGEVTISPSYTDYPEVGSHALEFFYEYDGTGEFHYEDRESVELVPTERIGEAKRRSERLASAGYDVDFLDGDEIESLYPGFDLGDEFEGGVRHVETGFVDPYTFATTLADDATERGATFLTDTAVTDVLVDDGAVVGVDTDVGRIEAPTVVVAAGWRTSLFLEDVTPIPVRPYRTQCIVLDLGSDMSETFPMGWIPGEHVYFRPELNGDVLVGGWSFATDDPVGASGNADEEFVQHVADLAPRFLADGDNARFVNGWAGVDGATPDTRPIIDAPADAPDGLVVATGFHGRGVMTAPVAATLVRSIVTGEETDLPREPFSLDRFENRSREFRFVSISSGDEAYEED
ncbi:MULTISPECIES: FAD-binding oxidoreductase [Haloferax]|uniref:FAD-dependent oxidoreductase n=1 Tax=Haloferax marinum TaxID=2666143 RepID=A0A6A8GCH2_9EURY|nr:MULTISPECIES: FAD-dependent oxidoreductase [Haloferax]KAB1190707.1 FAD-binding oxidoreductase [Haloferax sp. CBA1150]MRW98238.1 FAD-dependent oxidoreductase [Haloferax marinum]